MSGLAELRRLACDQIRAKYPHLPEPAICPPKYETKTANGLTRAIVDFITLSGGWATRISTTGQMRPGGGTETNPAMKWVYGTSKLGTADIHAVFQGLHLSIEVKIGRDRQSVYQKNVEAQVTAAGGVYYLARDFNSFYEWITTLKEKAPLRAGPKYHTTINTLTHEQR
jgi:hypothetical protein